MLTDSSTGKRGNLVIDSKRNARITGVLLILGTVPIVVAMGLWGQPLSSPDYLSSIAAHGAQINLLALTIMVMGLACAGIGISLYPVLKPHGEGAARAVMGFRLMEGTLQVASAIGLIVLLAVSQEFVKAGSPPDSFFQPAGAAIKAVNDWVSNLAYVPVFCIGASIYYTVFYRTRLVPRWLSAWGLLGLALLLGANLAVVFGFLGSASPLVPLLTLPIFLQELVLAAWLIVRGFDPSALASGAESRRHRAQADFGV
jgi:hypothetical protein